MWRCTSLLVYPLLSPCALPASGVAYVSLASCVRCKYPCVLGRLVPSPRCVCVPGRTCRAFSLFFLLFCLCPHCASLPIEPVRSPAIRVVCFSHSHGLCQRRKLACTRIPHNISV